MAAVEEQTILSIDVIRTDGGTQPRAEVDQDVIRDYAQQMFEGVQFPPVTVYYDGTDYWLADGFHRYYAAKQQCKDILYADVRQGTRRDAVLFSVGANATHGLRRTNNDKRRAVETLLNDPEWTKWSDSEVARRCGVHQTFVGRVRASLMLSISEERTYITKHGTIATMNTAKIGQQPSSSEREASLAGYRDYGKWQEAQRWETKQREVEKDEPDTEPELQAYTPPRYEAPTWTPTVPPSPAPVPAPMPSSPYDNQPFAILKQSLADSGINPDDIDWEEDEEDDTLDIELRYDGSKPAYCKYCYETHNDWTGHEDGWQCRKCGSVTADVYMQIEGVEPSEEQKAFIRRPGGVPHALQMSESNEWYTPAVYVDAARELMGGIDVDPASNPYANEKVVHAATYYDIQTNGLDKDWTGRVWMNPPYGRESGDSNQEIWTRRLVAQFDAGITTEAVILVNAVTDRKWFQPLWRFPICFTNHRIRFYNTEIEAGQPTHGNALIYLGPQVDRFIDIFEQFGPVVRRVRWQQEQ